MIKARKRTTIMTVTLSNGGILNNGFNVVSFRHIKNGKPSGKTFTKQFASEAEAEQFYNNKGE